MDFASLGPLGGPLGALFRLLWGLLDRLGGILGHLGGFGGLRGPSWKPSWASWTPWRAPRTCLSADRASKRGGDACRSVRPRRWGPLRRLQKPYQTALGILARLNVPGGTVADSGPRRLLREMQPAAVWHEPPPTDLREGILDASRIPTSPSRKDAQAS